MHHKKTALLFSALAAAWIVAAPATAQTGAKTETTRKQTMSNGLIIEDTKVGTGAAATEGHSVVVHYTGWLYDEAAPNHHGKKFDSSLDRSEPFTFPLGGGRVIKGWDQGVAGMLVGGKRTLTIPADLGYGARGAGGVIPPGATLVFDVELLDVK